MTETLTDRQQQVLDLLNDNPGARLSDIAAVIGVSRQRIDQIISLLEERGFISNSSERRRLFRKQGKNQLKSAELIERARRHKMKVRFSWMKRQWKHRYLARIGAVEGRVDYHASWDSTMCRYQGCPRPVRARGFCNLHYTKLRSDGAIWVRRSSISVCMEEECILPVYALNRCRNHYTVYRRSHPPDSNLSANNKTGYRGVVWSESTGAYIANIGTKKGQLYLGSFQNPADAGRAYDSAARLYHGDAARLNFPEEHEYARPKKAREVERKIPQKKQPIFYKSRFSQYRGVSWDADTQKWISSITIKGVKTELGFFDTEEDAAVAYDDVAKSRHGDRAVLNFPLRHD